MTAQFLENTSAENVASSVNTKTDDTCVNAQAITWAELSGATGGESVSFDLQGSNAIPVSANITATDYSELSQAMNSVSGQTGITSILSDDKASVTLLHTTGENIKFGAVAGLTWVTVQGVAADGTTLTGSAIALTGGGAVTVGGNVSFYSAKGFTVGADIATTIVAAKAMADTSSLQLVATIDVSTVIGSNTAINIIDGALSFLTDTRADQGYWKIALAVSATVANLENIFQNVSAVRSRIQDADFTKESAELAKNQILQ